MEICLKIGKRVGVIWVYFFFCIIFIFLLWVMRMLLGLMIEIVCMLG